MAELNEEKLEQVYGGAGENNGKFPVNLIGEYWDSSTKDKGPFTYAIGWPNLYAEYAAAGKPAPYRLSNGNGTEYIGWTEGKNITIR